MSRKSGFTLIELLIVVSLIAIISAIAIPNLMASRLSANESAAIATLRTVASAQAAAHSRLAVDTDVDGIGEYLYLGELGGTANLRGQPFPMDPAAVSLSLGTISNGSVNKSGYRYALFLPAPAGVPEPEDPAGGKAAVGAVDPDLCETFWVAYAWPTRANNSGRRAFVINQSGNILQTDNQVQLYDGLVNAPAGAAAYTAPNIISEFSISGLPAPAQDGGLWIPTN